MFIVGRGRSGTTLLKSMLDAHPDVSIAPESLFIMHAYNKYKNAKWTEPVIEQFVIDIKKEGRLKNWDLNNTDLLEKMLSKSDKTSFSELCKIVYSQYASENKDDDVIYIGDKNPHYALFLPDLVNIFPDAMFVHLVRDYRDNILSYMNVGFDLGSAAALAYRWVKYNKCVIDMSKVFPKKFQILRYEDLVSNPETYLKVICDFLGLEYTRSMLEFDSHGLSNNEWHKNLKNSVDPGQSYKWKNAMCDADLLVAEKICGKMGEMLGYPVTKEQRYSLSLLEILQYLQAAVITWLEKVLFGIPLGIRSLVLTVYRKLTR